MKIPHRSPSGLTRLEIIVALVVLVLLALLIYPSFASMVLKGRMLWLTSDARQIHLSVMSMAADGTAKGNTALGWPGDLKARGVIRDTADFANVLVRGDYLKPEDLRIFCNVTALWGSSSAPGFKLYKGTLAPGGTLTPPFSEKNNAFKIYLVKDKDPSETIFLTTKNYTYGAAALDPKAKPFGDKGFVICRKAGDVSIFKSPQTQNPQLPSPLPGGSTVESAENCLNP